MLTNMSPPCQALQKGASRDSTTRCGPPPPHHLQLGDADRRRQHPTGTDPVPQRSRRGLLHQGADRLGRRHHRGGPRDPGIDRPRRRGRRRAQDRDAHAVGPAGADHAQAAGGAAGGTRGARGGAVMNPSPASGRVDARSAAGWGVDFARSTLADLPHPGPPRRRGGRSEARSGWATRRRQPMCLAAIDIVRVIETTHTVTIACARLTVCWARRISRQETTIAPRKSTKHRTLQTRATFQETIFAYQR